jgi:hypothetical protein
MELWLLGDEPEQWVLQLNCLKFCVTHHHVTLKI